MSRMTWALLAGLALALAACAGASEPELAIMGDDTRGLPRYVDEPVGVPVNDLTHVADADHLQVFASRDDDADWCVVLVVEPTSEGSDWVVSSSCAPPGRFASEGVWVRAGGPSRGGAALLLPDGFDAEVDGDWRRVDDNAAVRH